MFKDLPTIIVQATRREFAILRLKDEHYKRTMFLFGGAAVMNFEDDIAAFTIKVANDPRTINKLVIYRPPGNTISQSELVALWEKKTGKTILRIFLPEEEIVRLRESKKIKSFLYLYEFKLKAPKNAL